MFFDTDFVCEPHRYAEHYIQSAVLKHRSRIRNRSQERYIYIYKGGVQNNGNIKKLTNRICVGYIERTSFGNTEYSSICLHSVVLVSVH
jgi:hypothetical protein